MALAALAEWGYVAAGAVCGDDGKSTFALPSPGGGTMHPSDGGYGLAKRLPDSRLPHDNVIPDLVLNSIIAVRGAFPTRP